MTIAAISDRYTEKDLSLLFPGADIGWVMLKTVPPPGVHTGVAAWLDLDFTGDAQRSQALARLLPDLVIVNAVVPTTGEIGYPFVRMNGWPGWPEMSVHELAAPDHATAERVKALYGSIGHEFRLAPDTPGMIGPRILAAIINEAWFTWEAQVSSKEEIDTAMRLGTNYPFGPFEWSERIGIGNVLRLLRALSRSDARYTPCEALERAAEADGAVQSD
ncbi:MAG TPA: 3-hydroxyacyl-CoA dehydrogenase family protein [Puia sp.]|nr:3-hydroxyacyl-CoA dehydrogenase family protein [Puia sp.]